MNSTRSRLEAQTQINLITQEDQTTLTLFNYLQTYSLEETFGEV